MTKIPNFRLNEVLSCSSASIEEKCGYEALLHVYDLHIDWAKAYNQSCVIKSPEPKVSVTISFGYSEFSQSRSVIK